MKNFIAQTLSLALLASFSLQAFAEIQVGDTVKYAPSSNLKCTVIGIQGDVIKLQPQGFLGLLAKLKGPGSFQIEATCKDLRVKLKDVSPDEAAKRIQLAMADRVNGEVVIKTPGSKIIDDTGGRKGAR